MRVALLPILLLCLGPILFSGLANAQEQQPPGYWLQHFTDENGLPQNSVKAIMQDRNGFVWLATEAGLSRFDGHRFMTFDNSAIPISSNRIRGFVPSLADNPTQRRYEFYALSEENEYIGVLGNGLASVDTVFYPKYRKRNVFSGNEVRHNSILASLPAQYEVDPFYEHYFASADNESYYIWWKDAVTLFRGGKRIFQAKGPYRSFILIGSVPYGVDSEGQFIAVRAAPNRVSIEGDIQSNPKYIPGKGNLQLFWNNVSQQAFLYLNKCFYTLTPARNGNLTTRLILKDFDFDNKSIVSACFDERTGFLLLGSITKGLFLIKKQDFQTLKLNEGDADNVYYAQIPAAGRSILTAQGYLLGANAEGTEVTGKRVSRFMEEFNYKFTMTRAPDGTFWFGVSFNLYKLDATGQKVLAHVRMPEKLTSLLLGPEGKLWIGCETNALYGLNTLEEKPEPKLMFRLGVRNVKVMGIANADTMFLGMEGGLYRLNIRNGRVQKVGLSGNINVRSFYTTKDGTWITTYGSGIYLVNKNKVARFPLDSDRFLATAHCIVEDKKGFFWITTNRGLFQVAKKELLDYAADNRNGVYYLYYDKRHGFATNEFNGGCNPCALTLADGTVSLPSMDGLVWYKPETIRPELPDKRIFISSLKQDRKDISIKDTLTISRDFEQLFVTVTTPYLGNVRNIRMDYSLSGGGQSGKWIPVSGDFVIPVSMLPHGNYILKIRKVNGFRTNDFTHKIIHLHVPRAWYETWWFQCLAIMAGAALFFWVVKWRTSYLLKKERESNLLRHYRVISQIVAAVNHDIQTPLHYIGYSLKQINGYLHKQPTASPIITRMSDESLNTSRRLGTLTKNLLDYIKLQNKSVSSRTHMGDVTVFGLVSSVSELFSAIATFRNINVRNTVDPGFTVYSDHDLLSIVVHNLVDNAVKVSRTEVVISTGIENRRKQIVIEDDGVGMPDDLVKWLNKNYRSYEEWLRASQNPDQKGIGLVIVKDLCVLLGIKITVLVSEDEKTMISLSFSSLEK